MISPDRLGHGRPRAFTLTPEGLRFLRSRHFAYIPDQTVFDGWSVTTRHIGLARSDKAQHTFMPASRSVFSPPCKGAGSGMAGMAAAIPIQNLVWRRHTNQK